MYHILFIVLFVYLGVFGPAQGGLITSLTVVSAQQPDGLYSYTYTLFNEVGSDLPAVAFALNTPIEADLSSVDQPIGWISSYLPGDTEIVWEASDTDQFILPGQRAVFMFISPLSPGISNYEIVGFDEMNFDLNFGQISGPSLGQVPEPTGLMLLGTGSITLCCYAYTRKRSTTVQNQRAGNGEVNNAA